MLWGEGHTAGTGSQKQTLLEALGNTIGNRKGDSTWFSGVNQTWQQAIEAPKQFGGYSLGHAQPSTVTDVDPFLVAAANVFYQSYPQILVAGAQCFFSPINLADWKAINTALASGLTTTSAPIGQYDPKCYGSSTRQLVIKTSTRSYLSGMPYFIFERLKSPTDAAVVRID